jgi:polar amino acid transport system substrate-binding protein
VGRRPVRPVLQARPEELDFDINQISYTPERDKAVDFSESYYDVNQSVVAVKGTPIANAKTKADLKQYKLGAQIGTTSLEYITENIQPDQEPSVYDTNNDVVSALQAKQIDGAVVDLPTAFYMAGAQIDNGVIVGKFPALPNSRERFGMVFEQGSPLVRCVNQALDFLKARGTLNEIQELCLGQKVNVLVLN